MKSLKLSLAKTASKRDRKELRDLNLPFSPLIHTENNKGNSSDDLYSINISKNEGKIEKKSAFAIKHVKKLRGEEDQSHSSALSDSVDSFIEEIEEEEKKRDERKQYLDDSDEEDFLLPTSIKLKILEEKAKNSEMKQSLIQQEEELKIK